MSDTTLTPERLAELRAKAHEVLAWNADDPKLWLSYDTLAKMCNLDGCWAELIELLDPGTVLALLDAAEELPKLRERLETAKRLLSLLSVDDPNDVADYEQVMGGQQS